MVKIHLPHIAMNKRNLFIVGGLVAVAVEIILRVIYPEADLPFNLCFCQAECTDWPWYINRALADLGYFTASPDLAAYNELFYTFYTKVFLGVVGMSSEHLTYLNLFPGIALVALMGYAVF